ncbi:hypothetical protein QVD17_23416 [Tagetes erecta]|uniref:Uncharacterized protein n=1 Tax=Tagetes erecta TaxID=13708 RepID=A0AAD8NU98_TARER|nr:hypothetical protein QVD17_23416 [Tagetes erecta]
MIRKQYFQTFLLLVLIAGSLPALQGSWKILKAVPYANAPSSYPSQAPSSIPAPALPPTPPPTSPPPPATPPVTPRLPPPTGGGGGGGSSGLSGGQKAGILVGVVVGAGLIGFATMVYMKRRSNVRRARFGILARRSQL